MILFGDIEHGRLVARKAGIGFDPEVDFAVSRITEAGELLGGVIYTNYTGVAVQMHQAGWHPRFATTQFMWVIYDFPFNMLHVDKVIATVPSTNERAMKITQQMGFTYVTTVPGVVRGGDMEILSMSRQACRWLKLGWRFSDALMENAA